MDEQNLQLESLKIRNYEMYKYLQKGLEIISTIKSKTYEAYIIGGAVRDFVLNIDFNDIDIATNATPEAIKDIFTEYEIDDSFANLGSIVLKVSGFRYEITTFRNEEYVKSRIKEVHYSKKLVEDIIRRDFTINALALTPNLTLIDIVEGKKDLEKGIVRVIGSGKRRFRDDPSRILRGLHLVAKLNFDLDSNTEKAMRKSKVFLKELSDQKILSYMYKIIKEPYGHKALEIIDDNALFKAIPTFAYWVGLLLKQGLFLKPYKQLQPLEKMSLFYRVVGNPVVNTILNKEEFNYSKRLYELSLNLSGSKVDPMLVFKVGSQDLLAADIICKVYNHKYRRQKKQIRKINKKLQIHSVDELDFTMRELLEMLRGNERMASTMMNEIVASVVRGELYNRNHLIKEFVTKMISNPYSEAPSSQLVKISKDSEKTKHSFFKKKADLDERHFDDSKEERKLYERVYDEYEEDPASTFDAWDQISFDDYYSTIDSYVSNNYDEQKIQMILSEYNDDFNQIYKIYLKGVTNYNQMNLRDQIIKQEELKQQVKSVLLRNNDKYRILDEKGLI